MVGDGVVGGRPLGVEGHRAAIGSGEVADALAVGIGSAAAVGFGVPACEGVVRTGEGVGGEVLRYIVGEGLVCHRARGIRVVLVEMYGIGVVRIFGGEGHVAVGTVHGISIAVEGLAAVIISGFISDVIACLPTEVVGERQFKALAVVAVVVVDEAVGYVGGSGGDAGDAAADSHLAGTADVGAGIALTNTAIGTAVEVEVFEGAVLVSANDGAIVRSARSIMGIEDHTVLNSGIVGFADE